MVGTRPQVAPLEAFEAIAAANDLAPDALRIASSAPEDFILLLPDEDAISRVLRGGGSVSTERFRLLLKRWNRQAHATCRRLLFRADISMGGIPPHAWDLSMRKLGIIGESEHISIDAQDDYARLFMQELSQTHIAALAALFGWSVPDDAEVRGVDLCVWV